MACDNCHLKLPTKAAVLPGKGFGYFCAGCIADATVRMDSVGKAAYHRQQDIADHRRDMLQPRNADGTPNENFVREYPEESKEIFTEAEIQKADR